MAKKIETTEKKQTLKKNKDENQENGIQKGREEGNENVTESLQNEGEQGGKEVIIQNEGELQVTSIEEPVVVSASVVAPKPEKTWDWVAIDAKKAKEQELRKR
jgi:hypothetical protein